MNLNPASLWLLLPHRTGDRRMKKRMCWEYVKSEILLSFYFHSCFLFPIGSSPHPWMFYILTQKWCFKLPSSAMLFHCCHRTRGRHKPTMFRRWGRCVWQDKKPTCRVEQQERQGQAQVLVGQMSCAALAVLTAASAIWAPRASPEPPGIIQITSLSGAAHLEKIKRAPLAPPYALWDSWEFCTSCLASEAQPHFPTSLSLPCTLSFLTLSL